MGVKQGKARRGQKRRVEAKGAMTQGNEELGDSGVICKKTWDVSLPNWRVKERVLCWERRQSLISLALDSPGCLYCSPIPHHAREIS